MLVDADEYWLALLRYIHLNPVRARMVAAADEYSWSSHRTYLGQRTELWVTAEFALVMFHPERLHAISLYRQFINESFDEPSASPLNQLHPDDPRVLGGDRFLATLLQTPWQPKSRCTLTEPIDSACQQFNVTPEALRSPTRERTITRARAWVAHQALLLRIASLCEVARTFHRSEASLRESVKLHFNYP